MLQNTVHKLDRVLLRDHDDLAASPFSKQGFRPMTIFNDDDDLNVCNCGASHGDTGGRTTVVNVDTH